MQTPDDTAHLPSKWVILIGLDFYVDHTRRLRGAVNDVVDVQLFLSRNHTIKSLTTLVASGTEDESQREPTGPETSWPTYENVTREFDRVTRSAVSGDYVYIHYSGHGALSPTTAEEYEEHPGSDAALVLYDRITGVRYLHGIELASLLDQMVGKGLQLTIVLDCCHSGAISRSGKRSVRGIPWDAKIAAAYPKPRQHQSSILTQLTNRDRDASTSQHWLLHPQGYTLLGACGPTELASECSGGDGRMHGALTYFLFKTLSTISRNNLAISMGLIHRRVCAELRISLPRQHPVILGCPTSILLSHDRVDRSTRGGCNILDLLENYRVTLNVGRAHMVGLGDEYIVKPFASDNTQITESSALYRIAAVHDLHSEAESIRPPISKAVVAKGWHAALIKPARARARVTLSLQRDEALCAMIAKSPWLELVGFTEARSSIPSFHVAIKDNGMVSIDLGVGESIRHLPLDVAEEEDGTKRLVTILEHLAKFVAIEGLGNNITGPLVQADFSSDVATRVVPSSSSPEFSIDIGSKLRTNTEKSNNIVTVRDEEVISIAFENHTRQSLFLMILNLTPLRRVSKIYPSSDRGEYKEIPPRSASFTGRTSFKMRMKFPSILKSEVEEVEDVLKFFITTRPVLSLLDALELPELSQEGLAKSRKSGLDMTLLNILDDTEFFYTTSGTSRAERGRWTCLNFLIRTQRTSS
jgi:hypothetical protein